MVAYTLVTQPILDTVLWNIMPKEVLPPLRGHHSNSFMPRFAKTKMTPKDAKDISKPRKVTDSLNCGCATF